MFHRPFATQPPVRTDATCQHAIHDNMSTMSMSGPAPEWQNVIRARLMATQAARDPLKDIIEQCECAGARLGRGEGRERER